MISSRGRGHPPSDQARLGEAVRARTWLPMGSGGSALDERLQAVEGVVPLAGDLVEVGLGFGQALGFELPDAFATATGAADQAGLGEHLEVFGDRLARDGGVRAQASDRAGAVG